MVTHCPFFFAGRLRPVRKCAVAIARLVFRTTNLQYVKKTRQVLADDRLVLKKFID